MIPQFNVRSTRQTGHCFTTKPTGSGIGLALSRQIAEAHGGSLTLENRSGHPGCIARLLLPLEAERTEVSP